MQAFIVSMFVLGLGTSLHCVSMCGPLVLTYAVKGEEDGPWYRKMVPNVAYQGAKILSYMMVGLLLGAVGAFLNLDAARPYVYYVAGVFMIVLGLGMTGKVPWAARLTPRPPKFLLNAIVKLRRKSVDDAEHGTTSLATPITFGLMTGLLPCGPLMAAQVAAAASGSALTGAVGMAAFGLGTAPLMVAFGTAGSMIPRVWKQRMMSVLAIGVILFGVVFINRGLWPPARPVTFAHREDRAAGRSCRRAQPPTQTAADGVVEVPLTIENTQFVPQVVQIPADKPVRLVVDRKEDVACSDQIFLPQLGILADLAPNAVTVGRHSGHEGGRLHADVRHEHDAGSAAGGHGSAARRPQAAAVAAARHRGRRRSAVGGRAARQAHRRGDPLGRRGPRDRRGLFGFSPIEMALIVAAVVAALVAGLALGGMFT